MVVGLAKSLKAPTRGVPLRSPNLNGRKITSPGYRLTFRPCPLLG